MPWPATWSWTWLAQKFVRCATAGTKRVTLKPSKGAGRALRKAKGSVKLSVVLQLRGVSGAVQKTTRSVTLRR